MGIPYVGPTPSNPTDLVDKQNAGSPVADIFPRKSGQYYTTTHPLTGTNTDGPVFGTGADRMWLLPLSITHEHTADRLGINVSTAGGAGSLIRIGLYPHSSSWGTVSKLVSASVAADSTGDKAATISQLLPIGQYWIAVATTDTSGTLVVRRGGGFGQGEWGGGVTFYSGEWAMRYTGLTLTTDLPATVNLSSPSSVDVNDVPLAYYRKA